MRHKDDLGSKLDVVRGSRRKHPSPSIAVRHETGALGFHGNAHMFIFFTCCLASPGFQRQMSEWCFGNMDQLYSSGRSWAAVFSRSLSDAGVIKVETAAAQPPLFIIHKPRGDQGRVALMNKRGERGACPAQVSAPSAEMRNVAHRILGQREVNGPSLHCVDTDDGMPPSLCGWQSSA